MAIDPQSPNQPAPWTGPPAYLPPSCYSAPSYYPPPYAVVPTSGAAVASLICSLLGLISLGLLSIPGVICGHVALPETRTGRRGGHGLAIAGLIIGWIQIGGWLLFWLVLLLGGAAGM